VPNQIAIFINLPLDLLNNSWLQGWRAVMIAGECDFQDGSIC